MSPTSEKRQFVRGDRYRVVREGCYLRGMRPIGPGVESLWRRELGAGDVITCAGVAMTAGDGVPVVQWLDEDGTRLANDCEFQPDDGRTWGSMPVEGFLLPDRRC
jgi:hypothetical protein